MAPVAILVRREMRCLPVFPGMSQLQLVQVRRIRACTDPTSVDPRKALALTRLVNRSGSWFSRAFAWPTTRDNDGNRDPRGGLCPGALRRRKDLGNVLNRTEPRSV